MHAGTDGAPPVQGFALPRWLGSFLFMASSLFMWISVSPFVDLTDASATDPSAGTSNPLYQMALLLLSAVLFACGLFHPLRSTILRPRLLIAAMLLWFLAVSLFGAHPMLGVKGIVVVTLVMANACIYLLLPASEQHFARMLGLSVLITLGVAYYGILFMPHLSIHQASELVEPMNAGLWRGHFNHKNNAAAAMAVATLIGLYIMRSWSRGAGLAIVALAILFLTNTGGKTSMAMLPATLVVAFIFEKARLLRVPIIVGGVLLFNFLVLGAAVIKPVNERIASLGIDATFTNRADIWRLAVSAIAEHPLTGYGFKGFWQTEELVYSGTVETWAVMAGHGHNSYLDLLLTTGLPGLLLALVWLVFLPLRDIARLGPEKEQTPLTRLFIRLWLFALFNAGLESVFFEGRNIVWFMLIVALAGIRLQARATLTAEDAPQKAGLEMPAHA